MPMVFNDRECLILKPSLKIPEDQILFRAHRRGNLYALDMTEAKPSNSIPCFLVKASEEDSTIWHRRMGHVNFRNMNRLVRGKHVIGLPEKEFVHVDNCVACSKGKQHKTSHKSKPPGRTTTILQQLHLDLFGQVNITSLGGKSYCLVITDDYSRYSWVFFLREKSETAEILKNFVTRIENTSRERVRIIRSDNRTEFKNQTFDAFCNMKGITRQFSSPYTPHQNGVVERKNRTIIESARTMLVDSNLKLSFWAKAVNTACYVLNRALLVKHANKTPFELFSKQKLVLTRLKPFGCPCTVLIQSDQLAKFAPRADEGYFIGYFMSSAVYRVYNKRTQLIMESCNVTFNEHTRITREPDSDSMYDLDTLSSTFNIVDSGVSGNTITDDDAREGDFPTFKTFTPVSSSILGTIYSADPPDLTWGNQTSESVNLSGESTSSATPDEPVIPVPDPVIIETKPARAAVQGETNTETAPEDHDSESEVEAEIDTGKVPGNDLQIGNLESTIEDTVVEETRVHKIHPTSQIIGPVDKRITRSEIEHANSCIFSCFISQEEPTSVAAALKDDNWIEAMQVELLQFKLLNVWRLVEALKGVEPIPVKWIFKNK
ncbi:hypothetical protein SSX86_016346 [Deinandra increscens subsp. villosa]|uniref:Integrase catalytic domain-containing protein n=1 Tax=Deinandra increscens subsp. villosa TaxID=3103831 RepID=A0AAP0GVK2_9ASTR